MKRFNIKSLQRVIILAGLLLLNAIFANAQTAKWQDKSNNKNVSFYQVQQDFNQYWKGKKIEKGKGYKPFKRWEAFMAPRVYPSGDMTLPSLTFPNFISWQQDNANRPNSIASTGNWTELGPIGSPSGPSPYSRTGAGRINFVRFDPNNTNTMYVGAPDGGLWKSTNGGTSWTTNTDFLTIIGCSDLCIDPTNTQIMYLATGDLEGNRNSNGVLKSTDGGATWNTTGANWNPSDYWKISKMLMNPSDPLNMIVSTNVGIFRTTDGWATSNFQQAGDFKDMEFKPGDANTVYAAGKEFWKSTDNGVTWAQVTTGLPSSSSVSRIALGVTAGNSAYVYALIGKDSDNSYLGMYRSTNSGTSFSLRSSSPNLLGYEIDGSDAAGQAFYDLAVTVSPTNAEIVTTGGINHWQSTNGGTTWTNLSVWDSGEIHADVHEISYLPGSSTTIFSCNDGGIFKSTDNGDNFVDISNNLAISQVVGIGLSSNLSTTIVNGEQDNGTNLKTGSSWANINGGDGGECFIDPTNNNTIYIQYVQGAFSRSDDGGASNNAITTGLPSPLNLNFDFYSQWVMDPVNSNRLYVGGIPTLYTSANKGDLWTALGTPSGSGSIKGIAVAPSNTTIIYAIKDDAISRSTNSGTSFSNITGTLPVANAALSSVAVSNTDPNKVWVTFSGYSAGEKVFKSVNGGTSWTNISTGLPNLPMNEVVYTNNSATDAIYIAGDIGVYYLDNTLASFAPFMDALPNVAVRDLEIFYPTGKLRAGTYGRGVWESDLYVANVVNYTITASTGTNGTITPIGPVSVASGANQTFTITPNSCYQIATVLVDGVNNPAAVSSGTYTFTNVTAAHTISATFSQLTYAITSSAGPNGSITPNGVASVNCGATQTYSITPDGGYNVQDVLVDGVSQGAITTHPFTNVTATHSITASFVLAGGGCDVSGSGTTTPVSCFGNTDGTATVTLTGAGSGAPGTYTVDGGSSQPYTTNPFTITGLAAGNHTIVATVTAGGCVSTGISVNVETPVTFTATFVKTNLSSCNGPDGSITVTATGGSGTYNYAWTGVTGSGNPATTTYPNPGNVSAVTGLNYGFYNVTITDAGGCGSVTLSNIHVQLAYSVFVTNSGSSSSGCGNTGSIILYGNAGVTPYTYSLTAAAGPYQASNTFTGLAAGTYTGYVKDAGGCVSTKPNIVIGAAAAIVVNPISRAASSCANDGSIEIYRTGGIPPYTYSKDAGATYQASNTFTGLAAGPYTVYVKDSKNCTGFQNITVTQGAALSVSTSKINTSSCVNDGTIQVNVSGGVAPYTYSKDGGTTYQASNSFTGLGAATYTISVKDSKNCLGSAIVSIALNPIVVTASVVNSTTCISNNGKITLFRTGGAGPYTYSLDGNTYQASNVFLNKAPGTYTGFVKDSKTCVGMLEGIVVGPSCLPRPSANKNIDAVTGKLAVNNGLDVQASPNPSEAGFTISLVGYNFDQKVSVTVTDLLGRKVYQTEGTGKQQYRFGENFKVGMYNVQVVQGNLSKSVKVVKE